MNSPPKNPLMPNPSASSSERSFRFRRMPAANDRRRAGRGVAHQHLAGHARVADAAPCGHGVQQSLPRDPLLDQQIGRGEERHTLRCRQFPERGPELFFVADHFDGLARGAEGAFQHGRIALLACEGLGGCRVRDDRVCRHAHSKRLGGRGQQGLVDAGAVAAGIAEGFDDEREHPLAQRFLETARRRFQERDHELQRGVVAGYDQSRRRLPDDGGEELCPLQRRGGFREQRDRGDVLTPRDQRISWRQHRDLETRARKLVWQSRRAAPSRGGCRQQQRNSHALMPFDRLSRFPGYRMSDFGLACYSRPR